MKNKNTYLKLSYFPSLSGARLCNRLSWLVLSESFVIIWMNQCLIHPEQHCGDPAHLHRHFCKSISAEQQFCAKSWRCVARLMMMMQGSKCWVTIQQWSVPLHQRKKFWCGFRPVLLPWTWSITERFAVGNMFVQLDDQTIIHIIRVQRRGNAVAKAKWREWLCYSKQSLFGSYKWESN